MLRKLNKPNLIQKESYIQLFKYFSCYLSVANTFHSQSSDCFTNFYYHITEKNIVLLSDSLLFENRGVYSAVCAPFYSKYVLATRNFQNFVNLTNSFTIVLFIFDFRIFIMSTSAESDGHNGIHVKLRITCKFNDCHCGNG